MTGRRLLAIDVAIVLFALGLRLVGLDFGLPMAEARPDEITLAFQAMKFGTGDLNPHSFNYPSLFKYVVFGLFGAYYAVERALGHFIGKEDFLREFFSGAVTFRLLMRGWSAMMGTVCVALLLTAPGRRWAALFLAVCFLHVRDSHFGVTDITMTTLVTASVLASVALQRDGTTRLAVWAGALGGLAASTKYNGAITLVPLLLAAWLSPGRTAGLVTAGLSAMGVAFLVGSPWVLLDFATFQKDFLYEAHHLDAGHYVDIGTAWVYHLTHSLRFGLGLPMLIGGIVGLLALLRHAPRAALVLLSFPVVYYVAMGRGETAFFRYMLPVVPFLCMGAGALVAASGRTGFLLGALFAVPTLISSLEADRIFQAGDTRDAMGTWIEANVPADAEIVHAGAYTGAPMLQRNVVNQTREYLAKAGRADASGFRKPDDPKWYDPTRPAYDVVFVRKEGIDFASQRDTASLLADPPPWLVVESSPLVHYSAVPDEIRALAQTRYVATHEESPGEETDAVYDQQDAFYMPVSGFTGRTRLGPHLVLYRLAP